MSKITLITGQLERGKTTLCRHLVVKSRAAGLKVRGVLSPAVFEGDWKIGIDLIDLTGHEKRRLAYRDRYTGGPHTERWHFLPETLHWGNQILGEAVPCDVLVVDELGPLELTRGEGWWEGIRAVDSGQYRLALVVIRPSLLEIASQHWMNAEVFEINAPGQAADLAERILHELIMG